MPDIPYKLHIASKQHYSCILCGRCCRRFRVHLEKQEKLRIQNLNWGGDESPHDFTETINGREYFKRQADGGCVFLDTQGGCSIHRKFGFNVKALTCRGYPMNIVSTFPGELSALARMDCPAVLGDKGKPLAEQREDIEQLITEMSFGRPFNATQLCGLERPTLEHLRDFVSRLLDDARSPIPNRICAALSLLDSCQKLGATFLNDSETMKEVWPSLEKRFKPSPVIPMLPGLSAYSRLVFRTWLSTYCRRDEEILDRSAAGRLKLFKNNLLFILGHGSWRKLGFEHPDYPFAQAQVFKQNKKPVAPPPAEIWAPYLRFLQTRLECLQFFGSAYYDTDFYTGLRALLKTYPLVLVSARYHAHASSHEKIQEDDVFYAVLSIDHCHGRSPLQRSRNARANENYFSGSRFDLLLSDLGWM